MYFRLFIVVSVALFLMSCEGKDSFRPLDDNSGEVNKPPVADADADMVSGILPLEVKFSGSNSTDDNGIASYLWDFKNGSFSSEADPAQRFDVVGRYNVELTVKDENGLSHKDTVVITVDEPINEAPVAVASAMFTAGNTPLQVEFSGSDSFDDNGISSYRWEFKDGSSSSLVNPTHTFYQPGVYYVDLFVTDEQGLSDFDGVTITVEEFCETSGGLADETGLKTWCWGDIPVPSAADTGRDSFINGQLALDSSCSANQVVQEGDRLKFLLNPTNPIAADWCDSDFNYRAEIRTMPWQVSHSSGTEEWIGWDYRWDDYTLDPFSNYIFYQAHDGIVGNQPLLSLQIRTAGFGPPAGGLWLTNSSQREPDGNQLFTSNYTNIIPQEGQTMKFVLRVVWGGTGVGLYQLWIDGVLVVDVEEATVRPSNPVGGNSKFGLYYSPWRSQFNIDASAAAGVTKIETSMGALRIITRRLGDTDYGKNSFAEVEPH